MLISKSENQTLASFPDYRKWLLAIRPKTLSAACVPVVVASALAFAAGKINFIVATVCLLCALLLQISTNLINDAADFEKGADTPDRIGPNRMALLGMISPAQLYFAAGILLTITFIAGLYLVAIGGWPILVLGLASIIAAIAYTAGPYPLAYHGFGDLFVLIFFGIAAVCGTYYLQTGELNRTVFMASLIVGLQSVSLIVANNTRDIATDRAAKKNTLSVRLGTEISRYYYAAILFLPYLLVIFMIAMGLIPIWALIALAAIFLAIRASRKIFRATNGADFISVLEFSAKHQIVFSLLFVISILTTKILAL